MAEELLKTETPVENQSNSKENKHHMGLKAAKTLSNTIVYFILVLMTIVWLVPFVFLAGIGISILINLGSNYFLGEISYITKALSAVLQLAVTMDYSIFLWNTYNEIRKDNDDKYEFYSSCIYELYPWT